MYNNKYAKAMRHITLLTVFVLICAVLSACTHNVLFAVDSIHDIEYPKVYVTYPSNTDCLPGKFHVKGYATDDYGVTGIRIRYYDNSGDEHVLQQSTDRNFDIVLDLYNENVSSGDFKFSVTANDTVDHETTAEINISVDKECPVFTLFSPDDKGTGTVGELQIGQVVLQGMITDNKGLKPMSPNNFIRIYRSDDKDKTIIWSRGPGEFQTPFSFSAINTMDESIDAGEYTVFMSYEDVNTNIGTKQVTFMAAKGDTKTYITVDSPLPNFVAVDSLTIAGAATNAFADVEYVTYTVTKRTDSLPINDDTAIGRLSVGQAGSFSAILSAKSMQNMVSGEYNLRLTAYAADKTCSDTAVIPFEFSSELAAYDFIDNMTDPKGQTPFISSYINGDMTIDLAASSLSLAAMDYAVVQGGEYRQPWTSIVGSKTDIYNSKNERYHRYTVSLNAPSLGLSNGSFSIMARAKLSESGEWRTVTRPLYLDTVKPEVRITSHDEDNVTLGINGELIIRGACSDNMGLKSVQIKDNINDTWHDVDGTLAIWSYTVAKDEEESDIPVEQLYSVPPGSTKDVTFTVRVSDYAGNITEKSVTLRIDPDADKPVFTFLSPSPSETDKVSGTFTMSATVTDDDFPRHGINVSMNIYEYSESHTLDDYAKDTPVRSREWTIEPITGDLNLSDIIDTDPDEYKDLTTYIIILNGSGWKNAKAKPAAAKFYVDKTAPAIFIDEYNDAEKKFCTDNITFSGYVRYKADSELSASSPLVMQFTNAANESSAADVHLGEPADITENNIHYKKRLFSITLKSDGTSSGFDGTPPSVEWSDDEWGNSTKLFTFRATGTTAQQGVKTVRVYLDNHQPAVAIKSPADGYLFDKQGTQSFDLVFSVNDEPAKGNSYSLNFKDNVMVQVRYSGASQWTTLSGYGSGDNNIALKGDVTHNVSFSSVPDGQNHQLMITVRDNAGNESAPATLIFQKSTTPPAIKSFKVNVKKDNGIYKGTVRIDIEAEDSHGAADDGLASLHIYINDVSSENLISGEMKTFSGYKDYDTAALPDGTYTLSAKVTDKTGISVTNASCGLPNIGIIADNTPPEIDDQKTKGYGLLTIDGEGTAHTVDKWTAYIGCRVGVTDNISLGGVSGPKIRIGTTSGGDEILTDTDLLPVMSSDRSYSAEYVGYIDMFEKLGDNYNATNKIYVKVTASDAAGNESSQIFAYDKGTMPGVTFAKSEGTSFRPIDDCIKITGSSGSADQVFVKVGTGSYRPASVNGTEWSYTFPKSEFDKSGSYTFYAKGIKTDTYETQIVRCKYLIDIQAPTVAIKNIVAEGGAGYVSQNGSNWTAAGKIRISGTYNDDLADSLASVGGASLKLTIGSKTEDIANVTRNYSGTVWDWYYIWDTEDTVGGFLSSAVTSSPQTITVSAADIAGNTVSDITNKITLKPVIAGATGDIYPIRQLSGYVPDASPSVLKYSVSQGASVTFTGYNLKQDATPPTVKCGSNNVSPTSSTVHSFSLTVGTWQSGGMTVTVGGVVSDPVWLSIWHIESLTSSSRDYDTLDAEGYDACLLSATKTAGALTTNKVLATFARNHKIPGLDEYNERDYGAYLYTEGSGQAYRISKSEDNRTSDGVVDPVFYVSAARISDTDLRGMFTYDEFKDGSKGRYTRWLKMNQTKTGVNEEIYSGGGERNTLKSVRILYDESSKLHIAAYDDDSRKSSPSPKLYYHSKTKTANNPPTMPTDKIIVHVKNYPYIWYWIETGAGSLGTMTSEGNSWYTYTINETSANMLFRPNGGNWDGETNDLSRTAGEWWYNSGNWYAYNPEVHINDTDVGNKWSDDCNGVYDIVLSSSNKTPIIGYVKPNSIATLNIKYGSSLAGTFSYADSTGTIGYVALSARGGSAAGSHIVYQDGDSNLKYTYISSNEALSPAMSPQTVESSSVEGVSGAYPKVTIANASKSFGGKTFAQYAPNVSYINNASLNTKTALHFARAEAATPDAGTYWEYMVVPSPVSVNSGATHIMSDIKGNPVIVYKGNNRLYAARLQD